LRASPALQNPHGNKGECPNPRETVNQMGRVSAQWLQNHLVAQKFQEPHTHFIKKKTRGERKGGKRERRAGGERGRPRWGGRVPKK